MATPSSAPADLRFRRHRAPRATTGAMTPEPPSSRIESSDPRGDSAERVQPTLDAALLGTFVWSVDDDRWEADAQTWELFGLPPNGTSDLAARLHGDDAARYAAALTAAADPTGDGALHEVVRVDLPDGTPRSVE